ncbi:MAG: hypothetical protein RLZ12_477 [Bacillota bacterium]
MKRQMRTRRVDEHRKQGTEFFSLTFCYQPLIMATGLSVYLILSQKGEVFGNGHLILEEFLAHTKLMPLLNIEETILALEKVGLVSRDHRAHGEVVYRDFKILKPLAPHLFFRKNLLRQKLYAQVGAVYFKKLEKLALHLFQIKRNREANSNEASYEQEPNERAWRERLLAEMKPSLADFDTMPAPRELSTEKEPAISEAEERHLKQLAKITPLQLLYCYHQGSSLPESDVLLIKSLKKEFGLEAGVINVLLEYVLLRYNYRLPRNLVEKIAGHWKRLGITTIRGAFLQAKRQCQVEAGHEFAGVRKKFQKPLPKTFLTDSDTVTLNEGAALAEEDLPKVKQRIKDKLKEMRQKQQNKLFKVKT